MRAPPAKDNNALVGIASLSLGVLVFSVQDAILKGMAGSYPISEALVLRTIVAVPIIVALIARGSGLAALSTPNAGFLLVRALVGFGAYTCYYLALAALPLGAAVALFFAVPLIIAALSGPILGERPRRATWIAILIGVLGVAVMLRPGSTLLQPAAFLSLMAAFLYATQQIMARKVGGQESAAVMSFYQNAVFLGLALAAAVLMPAPADGAEVHPSLAFLMRPWVWPTTLDLALMASCGVIAAAGTILLTHAYRVAPANTVASFEYTALIWSPLWGFLFFKEIPAITTVIGGGLIVIAGLVAIAADSRARPVQNAEPGL
ncbi:MAG: DMT family transporter [Rhizobiaceae bacterium]